MRPVPKNKLNSKIKVVWRLSDALVITFVYLLCVAAWPIVAVFDPDAAWWAWAVAGVLTVLWAACLVVWLVIVSPIRWMRWRYEVGEHELDIARGILWRKRFIIPFVRVQNTDTKQGPILRAFGLASVTVATAAGEHEIPGLAFEEADELRDRIAEQARLAQEDV